MITKNKYDFWNPKSYHSKNNTHIILNIMTLYYCISIKETQSINCDNSKRLHREFYYRHCYQLNLLEAEYLDRRVGKGGSIICLLNHPACYGQTFLVGVKKEWNICEVIPRNLLTASFFKYNLYRWIETYNPYIVSSFVILYWEKINIASTFKTRR